MNDVCCISAGRKKAGPAAAPAPKLRPAGHLSDYRAVAAMMSLRLLDDTDFQNIGGSWCSELFHLGHMYRDAESGLPFVSLGFHFQCALLWQTEEVGEGLFALATLDVEPSQCRERLKFVCLNVLPPAGREEEVKWMAIPTQSCPLDVSRLRCTTLCTEELCCFRRGRVGLCLLCLCCLVLGYVALGWVGFCCCVASCRVVSVPRFTVAAFPVVTYKHRLRLAS